MKLGNTYLGFTDNKKAMQAGRIEDMLDKVIRSDGEYMKQKDFIYNKLSNGYKLGIEEDYTYWSSRKQDYTNPRTLYKLQNTNDNSFYEINKTLYNFGQFILDNGLLDENKVNEIIQKELRLEKEKQKQERLEREQKEMQRQKEEQERKERLKQRQNEWMENGKEFISTLENNPITEVLDKHWNEIKSIYKDEEKEDFYSSMTNRFTMMLGNKNGCIGWMKYFVERENDEDSYELTLKNNPIQFLEKELLFHVFDDVKLTDPEVTITAKVKARLENRQYKGGQNNSIKYHTFYSIEIDKETRLRNFVERKGQKVLIEGLTCFIKEENNQYTVIESRTGLSLGQPQESKNKAIQYAKDKVKEHGSSLENMIQKAIERQGISPLYQDQAI